MSFSFQVTAVSLPALVAAATAKMSEVVEQQPVHVRDADIVTATVERVSGLFVEADGVAFAASVSGSIGVGDGDAVSFANVSVSMRRTAATE